MPLAVVRHATAHLFEAFDEPHVALQRRPGQPFDGHFAAGDRRRGPEVARGRGVGLDVVGAAHVLLASGNPHARQVELCLDPRRNPA